MFAPLRPKIAIARAVLFAPSSIPAKASASLMKISFGERDFNSDMEIPIALNAIAASDVGFSASAMDFAMNLKAPPRSSNCTPESFATYCNFDNSDADTPNFFDASSRSDPSWMADLARFASAPTDTNPARDRPMESTTDSMPFSPCTEDVIARVVWSRSEEHTSELQSQSNLVCRL